MHVAEVSAFFVAFHVELELIAILGWTMSTSPGGCDDSDVIIGDVVVDARVLGTVGDGSVS